MFSQNLKCFSGFQSYCHTIINIWCNLSWREQQHRGSSSCNVKHCWRHLSWIVSDSQACIYCSSPYTCPTTISVLIWVQAWHIILLKVPYMVSSLLPDRGNHVFGLKHPGTRHNTAPAHQWSTSMFFSMLGRCSLYPVPLQYAVLCSS